MEHDTLTDREIEERGVVILCRRREHEICDRRVCYDEGRCVEDEDADPR